MLIYILEIEDTFCQTQMVYFTSKVDADKAMEYMERKYSEYSYSVYQSGLPSVTNFEQFMERERRKNERKNV